MDILPFASRLIAEAPWNTVNLVLNYLEKHQEAAQGRKKSPTKLHFFTLTPTLDEAFTWVKRIHGSKM
jgi:hypothetical protein